MPGEWFGEKLPLGGTKAFTLCGIQHQKQFGQQAERKYSVLGPSVKSRTTPFSLHT